MMAKTEKLKWLGDGFSSGKGQVGRRVKVGKRTGTVVSGTELTITVRWDSWWQRLAIWFNTLALLFVALPAQAQDAEPEGVLRRYAVQYVSCYDGDTCDFNIHLGMDVVLINQRFRLCDINAPEIRPLATRAEAIRSRDVLVGWLKAAEKISILLPQKKNCDIRQGDTGCDQRGKYGRWLGYILVDSVNLNQRLVDEGYAEAYSSCK